MQRARAAQFTAPAGEVRVVASKRWLLPARVEEDDLAQREAVSRAEDAKKELGAELIEAVPHLVGRGVIVMKWPPTWTTSRQWRNAAG